MRKRAHTITHSFLNTFRWSHCIGSTWSGQTTGVQERVLSSGHNLAVSRTFRTNVEDSGSNRASTTLQFFLSPSNYPKVCSVVIAKHHPPPVKPPLPLEIAGEEPLSIVPKPVESRRFKNHGFAVFLGAFSPGLSASPSFFFEWMPRAFNAEQA